VLFQTDRGMSMVRDNGHGQKQFLGQGARLGHADWSPDGRQVLFVRDDAGGRGDIWLADRDGAHQRLVIDCESPCTYAEDPAWSPNGQRVAYWTNGSTERTQVIRIAEVATGDVVQTVAAPDLQAPVNPRWSPDGRMLAVAVSHFVVDGGEYVADGSAVGAIDLNARAPQLRLLTPFTARASYPGWSPDGDRIVFVGGILDPFDRSSPGQTNLFTVRPDGSDLTQLTDLTSGGDRVAEPDWSGRGLLAVAVPRAGGSSHLVSLATDGTGLRPLIDRSTGDPVEGRHPRRAPG
jgi:Tol biopolymer transport system component